MRVRRTSKIKAGKAAKQYVFREMPFGVSIDHDIAQRFPDFQLNVIFDVGANVGQSALRYASTYPSSAIYCFEPIKATHERLLRNIERKDHKGQVQCFNMALGASEGTGTMVSDGVSTMNYLVNESRTHAANLKKTESVNISTLDEFCKANQISKISYLKIDTEGGDLDVLKGSEELLNTKGVDIVEVEAGMNPNNKHHVPLEILKAFLEENSYFIFGIYEQVNEWPKREPHLRRSNIVFISEEMIRNSRRR
ncbi:FkbM family methyltransferase [Neptuniibacter sp.]|uniref:FkbM family methyltransferase n=1 Tax=Neptuniibacter sp. TaxID=1962643 RepID=UPI0026215EAC|nr:FkbM family methyltransferase [Neptuniibacter sp.]MCP4595376.1 FkbM family methyltransferase [Neptuniibacter sp.]